MLPKTLALLIAILPAIGFAGEHAIEGRTVTVSGSARISAEPDIATVRLGVEERRPELQEARTAVNDVVARFLQLTDWE